MKIEIKRGSRYNVEARYFNANGFAVAIVASITQEVDWAAYVGATLGSLSEEETVQDVTKHGCKLPEQDARYFFPEFKGVPYRH